MRKISTFLSVKAVEPDMIASTVLIVEMMKDRRDVRLNSSHCLPAPRQANRVFGHALVVECASNIGDTPFQSAIYRKLNCKMPRGRPRKSSTTTATPASTSSRKRLSTTTSTPTRQSKRVKTSDHTSTAKATPKKSQHFHHDDEDKGEEEEEQFSEPESVISKEESGYEDEDESAVPSPSESEDEEDYYSDSEDVKPKKRARSKAQGNHGTMTPKSANGKELWRQGVKAGLGPGNQVVIKKPKAREAGNTPYKEDTIHPNTLLFLKDLKKNNDREWLKMNDPEFRQAERDFKSFIESLTPKMSEADETIPELPFKDIVSQSDSCSICSRDGISNDCRCFAYTATSDSVRTLRLTRYVVDTSMVEENATIANALFSRLTFRQHGKNFSIGINSANTSKVEDRSQRSICCLLRTDSARKQLRR